MRADVIDDVMEFVERLGGLRIQADVTAEVQEFDIFEIFHDDGFACRLSHKSQNFGMTALSKNDNLRVRSRGYIGGCTFGLGE